MPFSFDLKLDFHKADKNRMLDCFFWNVLCGIFHKVCQAKKTPRTLCCTRLSFDFCSSASSFYSAIIRSSVMNENLVLQNRLKEIRTEKKLSQSDLAQMVGVSRNTISSIETLQFCPTAKLALILCVALDKKFEDIFYFE